MKSFLVTCLVIFCSVVGVSGLMCYSCYGSGGVQCSSSELYIRARNGDGDPALLKNCTPPFDVMCYIEVYRPNGTVASNIRDCGDGRTFTFNAVTGIDYSNLTDHPVDNKTVCAGDSAHMFCLSKCDTDFCNGPQLDSAKPTTVSGLLILLAVMTFLFV